MVNNLLNDLILIFECNALYIIICIGFQIFSIILECLRFSLVSSMRWLEQIPIDNEIDFFCTRDYELNIHLENES